MDYADYQHILFEQREPNILWITLNRPEVLNAADARLHTELVELWNTIERDPDVRVAVVTGAGLFGRRRSTVGRKRLPKLRRDHPHSG